MNASALTTRLRVSGFTLIELLTVIAIIGVLAGLAMATLSRVRDSARSAQCVSNVRQIGNACLVFAADHKGKMPNYREVVNGTTYGWQNILNRDGYLTTIGVNNYAAGVWACPEAVMVPGDLNHGGYGPVRGIFEDSATPNKVNGRLGSASMIDVKNPSQIWLVGDAALNATDPASTFDVIWAPAADGSGWPEGIQQPGWRHLGKKANVCMFDGHVSSLTFSQLADATNAGFIPVFR